MMEAAAFRTQLLTTCAFTILPPQDCHVAIIKQYMVSIIYILYSYLLNKVGESILHTIKAQDKY